MFRNEHQNEYLFKLKQVIEKNFKYPLSVSDLAKTAGVSRSKLQHEFPAVVGDTIQNYQLLVRMNAAKEYLENTDFPLKRIAADVGYKSCRTFIRAFKKRTGITPERYRTKIA